MRRTTIGIAGLVAALALGVLAGVTVAGGDEPPEPLAFAPDRELAPLQVERVEHPAGAATPAPLRAKGGQTLSYFQITDPLTVEAATEEGATLQCPKGNHAINGFFVSGRPQTFLDLSAPEVSVPPPDTDPNPKPSRRNWVIAAFNSTGEPDQVVFGVVCLNKVK
jgi:hypothetical protein